MAAARCTAAQVRALDRLREQMRGSLAPNACFWEDAGTLLEHAKAGRVTYAKAVKQMKHFVEENQSAYGLSKYRDESRDR